MIDNTQKQKILERILQCEEFVHSSKHQKLLTYLINASIEKKSLKESDIASYMFNRGADFDSATDTIVRVSMHNLRSKLTRYYNTEGKNEPIQVCIEKGHYDLKFVQADKPKIWNSFSRQISILAAIIIALLLILCFCLLVQNAAFRQKIDVNLDKLRATQLWSDLVYSGKNKLIVLGDEFFIVKKEGKKKDNESILRRYDINSTEEFDKYAATQPDSIILERTPYSFFPKTSVWPIRSILKVLHTQDSFDFKESFQLQFSDLLTNDIIYIGSFRCLYILNEIIEEAPYKIHWHENTQKRYITGKDTTLKIFFEGWPERNHIDYCYLKKFPGPSNNDIILVYSYFETAMFGVIDIISDYKKLKVLENTIINSLGYSPQYYSILFKTTGHSRTALKTEVVNIEPYKADVNLW